MADQKPDAGTVPTAPPQPGTTARLFPELVKTPPDAKPDASKTPAASNEPPKPDEKTQGDKKTEDKGFDFEGMKDQKVRVKIDGQEEEVTLEQLRAGYQTREYHNRKGQFLNEQKKQQETLKKELEAQKAMLDKLKEDAARMAAKPDDNLSDEEQRFRDSMIRPELDPMKSALDKMQKELEQLRAENSELREDTMPAKLDRSRRTVSDFWKAKGFEGFYEGIKDGSLAKSAEELSPDNPAMFDTDTGASSVFLFNVAKKQQARIMELEAELEQAKKPGAFAASSGNPPPDTSTVQDKLRAAREAAKQSGDWASYFMLEASLTQK